MRRPEIPRSVVASYVTLALLSMVSGIALLNCPFGGSAGGCCPGKGAPAHCPRPSRIETCPFATPDAKIPQANSAIIGATAPVAYAGQAILAPVELETAPIAWTPPLANLHIRIRVLLI